MILSKNRLRGAIAILVCVAMVVVLVVERFASPQMGEELAARLQSLRDLGILGWFGLVVLQMVASSTSILPASLIGIIAGGLYGVILGFPLAAVGTLAGGLLCFWASRSLLRPAIGAWLAHRQGLGRMDSTLTKNGWKYVFLLRLSPVMPFAITSYLLGLSSIRLRDYLIGTLAALPALLMYVTIGATTSTVVTAWRSGDSLGTLGQVYFAVGMTATLFVILRLARALRPVQENAGDCRVPEIPTRP